MIFSLLDRSQFAQQRLINNRADKKTQGLVDAHVYPGQRSTFVGHLESCVIDGFDQFIGRIPSGVVAEGLVLNSAHFWFCAGTGNFVRQLVEPFVDAVRPVVGPHGANVNGQDQKD